MVHGWGYHPSRTIPCAKVLVWLFFVLFYCTHLAHFPLINNATLGLLLLLLGPDIQSKRNRPMKVLWFVLLSTLHWWILSPNPFMLWAVLQQEQLWPAWGTETSSSDPLAKSRPGSQSLNRLPSHAAWHWFSRSELWVHWLQCMISRG